MGMSISDDSLMNNFYSQKKTNNKIFALCFRLGGGIFTIGFLFFVFFLLLILPA
jgi:hypothetical protein